MDIKTRKALVKQWNDSFEAGEITEEEYMLNKHYLSKATKKDRKMDSTDKANEKEKKKESPANETIKPQVYDHLQIIDKETGEKILSTRG